MFYLCYVIFIYVPLVLRTHEWTVRGYVTRSCDIVRYHDIPSLDSLPRPLTDFGETEKCSKSCQKCDGALIWRVVVTKWYQKKHSPTE